MLDEKKLKELKDEIQDMKDYMAGQELSNDYYHTRGTYKEDSHYLRNLERELSDMIAKDYDNVIPFNSKR